jgi:hypothetical protein
MSKSFLPLAIAISLCFLSISVAQDIPPHALDGGTREHIDSVTILPAQNAPFSATVVTEWIHILPDGSTQTTKNHRTVARDSSGRVFQERRFFTPDGDRQVTSLSELDYLDPNRGELYVCHPAAHVCTVFVYSMPPSISPPTAGPLPNGRGSVNREDLGRQTIGNLELLGSREVTTINAGVAGNQKAESTVKEFWYSPYLKINVITKRSDPRTSSIQNFEVKDINLNEPDPSTFQPPYDYRLVQAEMPLNSGW